MENNVGKSFIKKYFIIISIFIGIVTILGFSYGYLASESGWELASQLQINKLYYSMTVNGASTSIINVPANSGTTYYNVEITSLNDIHTRYSLTYKSSDDNVTVAVSTSSNNIQEGVIGKYQVGSNYVKTVRLAITNNTSSAATVNLSVSGGYTWNPESQVSLATGYSRITDYYDETSLSLGLRLTETIDTIKNCTPTSTSPCLYKENINNYVTYGGYTWRAVGTYLIGGEEVLKLVLSENYGTAGTYSQVASKLQTFYNSLTDTSLIRANSPFNCTKPNSSSITCSGSANIGLLSLAEYEDIDYAASYLYTKPEEDYWLNANNNTYYIATSRDVVTTSSNASAYIRPSIYLKANVVNANLTSNVGTFTNPCEAAQGVYLTVNGTGNATTNIVSGYYAAGKTYTLAPPVNNSSTYYFGSWIASGTGASASSNSFTVGTGPTTITAVWNATYNYTGTYDTYVVSADGYYYVETWGAQGGADTPTNRGGYGGYSSGYVLLNQGDTIYIYVGEYGYEPSNPSAPFNGGGPGDTTGSWSASHSGKWAGGGATDIRYFGSTTPSSSDLKWNSILGLNSRIMVAGGGGGGNNGDGSNGGDGGGLVGGTTIDAGSGNYVSVATQKSGFSFGTGQGSGVYSSDGGADTGAGGGGYYGGYRGLSTNSGGSAGSSFISGFAGSNAITSSSSRTATNNTLHYSGKYFLNGNMENGVRTGAGKASVIYIGNLPLKDARLNNVRYIKDCINGNTINNDNHWVEIQAIKEGTNIALGKTVTGTSAEINNTTKSYSNITDGQIDNVTTSSGYGEPSGSGNQCVTVDLGNTYNLDEVAVWHYYNDGRTYNNNVTSVSSNNSTWTELINESKAETPDGKRSVYQQEIYYTVTYDCNNGSGIVVSRTVSNTSDDVLAPMDCGYTVTAGTSGSVIAQVGWSRTSNGSALSSIQLTEDTTLYATYGSLFSYSGSYNVYDDGSGNWRVKFFSSGTLQFTGSANIDIFAVGGGGGGGGSMSSQSYGGGGGGGGGAKKYVTNGYNVSGSISVTIGGGGSGGDFNHSGGTGGTSSFGSLVTAGGGSGGSPSYYYSFSYGGAAGSAGSSTGGSLSGTSVNGGSGGKGGDKGSRGGNGGNGSYAFGTSTNDSTLYGAGGGGGGGETSGGSGGTTGGGAGGSSAGTNGNGATANTGSGGGGSSGGCCDEQYGGAGASGIVIIRNHR